MLFTTNVGVLGLPAADLGSIINGTLSADAIILGIPFDGGVNALPGQRHGPELLRHHSPILPWTVDNSGALGGVLDPVSRRVLLNGRRVFDAGDLGSVPIDLRVTRIAYYKKLNEVAARLATCVTTPIFIGGDHSVSAPIMSGIADVHGPLHLLCFDAHLDFHSRPASSFEDITHGDFLGHLIQSGTIGDAHVYGIRTYLPADAGPLPETIAASYDCPAEYEASEKPVYLSIDLDVLDPAEFPGTGHPEPGGYRLHQLTTAINAICRAHRVVGVDIVEATYEEPVNRSTGSTMATVLMCCLQALLDPNPSKSKDVTSPNE
jgi:agmatinase